MTLLEHRTERLNAYYKRFRCPDLGAPLPVIKYTIYVVSPDPLLATLWELELREPTGKLIPQLLLLL